MQQIYRRTPVRKCDFNEVAKQLYWNHTSARVLSFKLTAYFQNTFSQEHLWTAASDFWNYEKSKMRQGFCLLWLIILTGISATCEIFSGLNLLTVSKISFKKAKVK